MFEVPQAKRVKRSEFLNHDEQVESGSDAGSRDGPGDAENPTVVAEPINYGFEYDFITSTEGTQAALNDVPAEPEDESYEFRLFAPASKKSSSTPQPGKTTSKSDSAAPKITLARSPSPSSIPTISEGRLLRPRPDSHYFAKPTTASQKQYSTTAVSTTNILSLTHTPWPGTSLPWRVIHLPSTSTPESPPVQPPNPRAPDPSKASTRTKPNKKRRILLRRRLAARTALATKSKPKPLVRSETGEILSLDPAEREKRSARNREKKLKRRQRVREKKAATAAGSLAGGEGAESVGGGGGGGDGDGDSDTGGD